MGKEGARLVVKRFCWENVLSSEGGPRNPDPGTTYCFAHDFGGSQDCKPRSDRIPNKLGMATNGKVWRRKERMLDEMEPVD